MERSGSPRPRGPVFIGGTGRCGTHAVASLAAATGDYALVPAELRLHVEPAGLSSFARGARGRPRFTRDLLTHWWRHQAPWDPRTERGVHRLASRDRYLRAVLALAAAPPGADRNRLCADFTRTLLDPLAPARAAWIEKSPPNCAAAGFLRALFPDLRLIHVVRDGRDVACSYMRVPWAPNDFEAALDLWERNLLAAHRGTLEVGPERVHRISLEALIEHDRERSLAGLAAFLGLERDRRLRAFFDRELRPENARIGRWRADLPRSLHARASARYRLALGRLRAAGVHPLPDPSRPTTAVPRMPSASLLDPWAAVTHPA